MRKPSLCGDLSPYAKGPFQHHGRPSRGNGDGAELEAEVWKWDGGKWDGAGSSGAGPLDQLGPVSRYGVWAFIKVRTDPHGLGFPSPAA